MRMDEVGAAEIVQCLVHAAQLMMCGCDRGSGWRNRFFGVVAGCGVWVGADLGLLGLMSQHTQKPFSSMCAMW